VASECGQQALTFGFGSLHDTIVIII
jgi:hypothetical protein